jgi:RNA polymerase sigma-70 factor, ECF subfamily
MTDIYQDIEAEIPRLRRYARVLARDPAAADDLVQECLTRALGKLHLWQEGSNLRAWLFTILHNQHVNFVRRSIRTGPTVEFGENQFLLSQPANQEKHLELRDLNRALNRLPLEQRSVILLVGMEGMSYGDVSLALGIPVGTVRSRLSRGRDALRQLMLGETERGVERNAKSVPLRRGTEFIPVKARRSPPVDIRRPIGLPQAAAAAVH